MTFYESINLELGTFFFVGLVNRHAIRPKLP
jgi:hypothetical protein